jgi:hypothetical protein
MHAVVCQPVHAARHQRAAQAFLRELDATTLESVVASNRGMDAVLGVGRNGKRITVQAA